MELQTEHPTDTISDVQIDAAIERSQEFESFPRIVEAAYRADPECEFLMLKLDNGRRLLIPREDLPELEGATAEQASEIRIVPQGRGICWPQIDDGLYLPNFLEHRWGKVGREVAA